MQLQQLLATYALLKEIQAIVVAHLPDKNAVGLGDKIAEKLKNVREDRNSVLWGDGAVFRLSQLVASTDIASTSGLQKIQENSAKLDFGAKTLESFTTGYDEDCQKKLELFIRAYKAIGAGQGGSNNESETITQLYKNEQGVKSAHEILSDIWIKKRDGSQSKICYGKYYLYRFQCIRYLFKGLFANEA